MTEEQIKHMVNRFLCWKVPEHFHPDNGISFDPVINSGTIHEGRRVPVGTNLLDYQQAEAMIRDIVEGLPETPVPFPYSEECCPGHVASKANGKICGNCGVHVDSFRPITPNDR